MGLVELAHPSSRGIIGHGPQARDQRARPGERERAAQPQGDLSIAFRRARDGCTGGFGQGRVPERDGFVDGIRRPEIDGRRKGALALQDERAVAAAILSMANVGEEPRVAAQGLREGNGVHEGLRVRIRPMPRQLCLQ